MPAAGGEARRLTSGTMGEIYPRYTADGQSIVYHSWAAPRRIWRVPREGGAPVPLTAGEHDDGYADPSADGRWLAFARTEGNEEERIYISPLGGGAARRLTDRPSTTPRWSPNGRLIAFSPGRSYDRGIFVIAPDGTGERRLTEFGGWPVWSPDGQHISYLRLGADGSQQIWTVPLAGGEPRLLEAVKYNNSNFPFDLSRDGTRLVTSRSVRVSNEIWLLEPPQD